MFGTEGEGVPPPRGRAPADQLQRHRREFVDPGMIGIGLMATVVLDIEANPGRREAEQHGQQEALPPRLVHEDQQRIQHREPGEEDGRLQVHLPAVAWPAAGGSEILLDPTPQLELEGVVVRKFQLRPRLGDPSPWMTGPYPTHQAAPRYIAMKRSRSDSKVFRLSPSRVV